MVLTIPPYYRRTKDILDLRDKYGDVAYAWVIIFREVLLECKTSPKLKADEYLLLILNTEIPEEEEESLFEPFLKDLIDMEILATDGEWIWCPLDYYRWYRHWQRNKNEALNKQGKRFLPKELRSDPKKFYEIVNAKPKFIPRPANKDTPLNRSYDPIPEELRIDLKTEETYLQVLQIYPAEFTPQTIEDKVCWIELVKKLIKWCPASRIAEVLKFAAERYANTDPTKYADKKDFDKLYAEYMEFKTGSKEFKIQFGKVIVKEKTEKKA